jgi:hypothetical protein
MPRGTTILCRTTICTSTITGTTISITILITITTITTPAASGHRVPVSVACRCVWADSWCRHPRRTTNIINTTTNMYTITTISRATGTITTCPRRVIRTTTIINSTTSTRSTSSITTITTGRHHLTRGAAIRDST